MNNRIKLRDGKSLKTEKQVLTKLNQQWLLIEDSESLLSDLDDKANRKIITKVKEITDIIEKKEGETVLYQGPAVLWTIYDLSPVELFDWLSYAFGSNFLL